MSAKGRRDLQDSWIIEVSWSEVNFAGGPSFAHELHDKLTISWSRVEFDEHDLLPGAQQETPVDERDRERRPHQRCAHVARAVVVAPLQMVPVVAVPRRQVLEHLVEVGDSARPMTHRLELPPELLEPGGNEGAEG